MAYNYYPQAYQTPAYYPNQSNWYGQQNNQSNGSLIWVQGEGAAKSYPVAPNTSLPLWDSEANVIYIKSADASGMPSIKILDYTVRDNSPRTAEISPQTEFATKDDLAVICKEIDALKAKMSDSRKERRDGKSTVRSDESGK